MRSPSQRQLTRAEVDRYAGAAFGVGVADCAELTGGGFAAVWWVRLLDGREVVLKVGPPRHVRLLRYETGLVAAEAHYLNLVAAHPLQVPVPPVLHHAGDRLFTGYLPGTSLASFPTRRAGAVRRQLGAAAAQLHTVTGTRFGYSGARRHAGTWSAAFTAVVADLLADAAHWQVPLPVPPGAIATTVAGCAAELDAVTRPALVHFDLWDGNVLATVDAGVARLSGLVDAERFLFADPLVDFVAPALFRRIEDEPGHPFPLGYADTTGTPVRFDRAARRRLTLYRIWLYLLMIVEMPSRGRTEPDDRASADHLSGLLHAELRHLHRS